jgi:hypothetical protein
MPLCPKCQRRDRPAHRRYCSACESAIRTEMARAHYLTPTPKQDPPRPREAREDTSETKYGLRPERLVDDFSTDGPPTFFRPEPGAIFADSPPTKPGERCRANPRRKEKQ